jgi:hypothetical protein
MCVCVCVCVCVRARARVRAHLCVFFPACRIRKRDLKLLRVICELRKLNLLHLFSHVCHHDLITIVLELEVHVRPQVHSL